MQRFGSAWPRPDRQNWRMPPTSNRAPTNVEASVSSWRRLPLLLDRLLGLPQRIFAAEIATSYAGAALLPGIVAAIKHISHRPEAIALVEETRLGLGRIGRRRHHDDSGNYHQIETHWAPSYELGRRFRSFLAGSS